MVALVDRILSVKREDPAADMQAEKQEVDRLVYSLYGLTPEEVALVEGQ